MTPGEGAGVGSQEPGEERYPATRTAAAAEVAADPIAEAALRPYFADLAQQTHAARLGMWGFLGSELLFFGALFVLYAGYRAEYTEEFRAAAQHTDLWLGSANTVILITASFLVALAVVGVRIGGSARRAAWLLVVAAVLGVVFMVLKGLEYAHHFRDGIYPGTYYHFATLPQDGAKLFFTLYYMMTGLHALHVLAGIVLLLALAWWTHRGRYSEGWHTPLELGGLYWHLVDVVWIFLWPIFYLLR
jgi:cytochrome c oxidase subunit 3